MTKVRDHKKFCRLFAMLVCVGVLIFQCTPADAGILKKLKGGGGEESASEPAAESAPAPAPHKGPKQVVAVGAFEGAGKLGWDEGPVMAAMLQDQLMQTGRFVVVERQQVDAVLKEQDLGAAGRINTETALKIGQIVGASIMIQGTVTQFEPGEEGKSGRVSIPIGTGAVGIGGSKVTSKVAMQLRIIDLTTSQVLSTHKAEHTGTHKSMGMDVYTSVGSVGGDQFKKTPLGETAEECIAKAVDHIIATMANVPFSARVAEVDGKSIYINAGTNRGMTEGTVLTLYKTGKVITDPDTGLALDVKMERTGSVKVDSVQEKIAVCSLVDGQMPKRGDTLKIDK
jgi:curli biogenesis system outer membrane secretion channel CsgG